MQRAVLLICLCSCALVLHGSAVQASFPTPEPAPAPAVYRPQPTASATFLPLLTAPAGPVQREVAGAQPPATPAGETGPGVRRIPLEESARLRLLHEKAGIPMADLVQMSDAEVRAALVEHAYELEMVIYELNADGEMELVVDGRQRP